jgi:hypothetical protein
VTDEHLSLDELAELDEGLLPGERLSAVQAHLHDCEQCRARADAIGSTRRMLAGLPAVTMPADVSARIDQNLAAAAPGPVQPRVQAPQEPAGEVVGTADAVGSAQAETIIPDVTEIRRSRFALGRPSAAAAAVVIVIALAVTAVVVGHHNKSDSAGAGADSAGSPLLPSSGGGIISAQQPRDLVKSSSGKTYTLGNLDTLVPTLVNSSGDKAAAGGGGRYSSPSNGTALATPSTPSSTASPEAPIHGTATQNGTTTSASGEVATTSDAPVAKALKPLADSTPNLLGCAARITTLRNAVPLAVDFGYWTNSGVHKAPAAVFVFKGTDPSKLAVYVTNATCSGNDLIRTFHIVTLP